MCASCNDNGCGGCAGIEVSQSLPGVNGYIGWSPQIAVVADGPTRDVLQLVGWTGGTGAPPGGAGMYVGPLGLVTLIADATNIRGTDGTNGVSWVTIPTHNGSTPFMHDGSVTYKEKVRFVFPGTNNSATPTAVLINARSTGPDKAYIQLYDCTNLAQVAEFPNLSATATTTVAVINSGMAWPADISIISIDIKTDMGTEMEIASVTLLFT